MMAEPEKMCSIEFIGVPSSFPGFWTRMLPSRISLVKVIPDRQCLHAGDDGRQGRCVGLLHRLYATEVFQQSPRCTGSDARNFQ